MALNSHFASYNCLFFPLAFVYDNVIAIGVYMKEKEISLATKKLEGCFMGIIL